LFKVSARTVLELGAELISSDVIAFYELMKNAFDAKSPTGAEIRFEILLRRNDYLKLRRRAIKGLTDIDQIRADVEEALELSAPYDSLDRFREAIYDTKDMDEFVKMLDKAYTVENRIIVSDNGTGMSKQDLIDNYLVIGTASRKRAIDSALAKNTSKNGKAHYLGEKGIGRI